MTRAEARQLRLTRSLEEAHAMADAVLAKVKAARRRTAPRRAAGEEKRRATKEEHRTETAVLRSTAYLRSGHCEACDVELRLSDWELHHVENAGLRRSRQRPGNVLALCRDCHRRAHGGDLGTLAQIAQAPSLDAEARRAARHRLAKIEEARRTA